MKRQTLFRAVILSALALMVMSLGITITVQAEEIAGEPFSETDMAFFIDSTVNATAEISARKGMSRVLQVKNLHVVCGAGLLLPSLLLSEFEGAALPLPYETLRAYYGYLAEKSMVSSAKDHQLVIQDMRAKLLDSTANDSGEISGTSEAYEDTFTVETDLEATTLLDFNSSDVNDWGVMAGDYRYLEEALADNATETDFMTTSQHQAEDDYHVLSTGVDNLEDAMIEVMEQNIAANLSVLPEEVHINWYNASATNQTTYMSQDFSNRLRQAEAEYNNDEEVAARWMYALFGIPLALVQGTAPMSFFRPVAVAGSITAIREQFGRVVSFGKLLVSKELPALANKITTGVKGTITKAQNIAKGIVHNGLKTAENMVKTTATGVQTFTQKLATGVQNVVTGAGQFVSKAVGGVVGTVQSVVGGIINFLPLILIGGIIGLLIVLVVLWFVFKGDSAW